MDTQPPNTNANTTTIETSAPPASPLDAKPESTNFDCQICHYPPWKEGTNDWFMVPGTEYNNIATSASQGCKGCALFQHALDLGIRHEGPQILEEFHIFSENGAGSFSLSLLRDHGSVELDVFTLEGEKSVGNVRVARMVPERTGLEESLVEAKRWLRACEERHEICSEKSQYTPMRLLDLGAPEGDDEGMVRLVLTEGWEEIPRYACLSHCWGTKKSNSFTKKGNIASNMSGIPFDELPKTFRDAVSLSRALGICYLWIDSLCIVQDDENDWALHVEVMANVYQDAYITLAAGASHDDEGGFFRTADKVYTDPKSITVKVDESGSEEATIHLRPFLPHIDEAWTNEPMALERRGWAFQERLLSRRFLCFGAHEVQWECHEDTACSCSTTKDGFNRRTRRDGKPGFPLCEATKYELIRLKDMDKEATIELWHQIVQQYSNRKLTFAADKLPALAGLAKVFAGATGDEYAHGHWASTLKEDLTWSTCFRGEGRPRKAPSWSWISASDTGYVRWPLHKPSDSTCHVHGIHGEVLELSAHVLPVLLEIFDEDDSAVPDFHCYVMRRMAEKLILEKDLCISEKIMEGFGKGDLPFVLPLVWDTFDIGDDQKNCSSFFADYKFWHDRDDLKKIFREVYILELGNMDEGNVPFGHPEGKFGWVVGLVLRKRIEAVNDVPDAYERIGLIYFHTGRPDKWQPVGEYLSIQIA